MWEMYSPHQLNRNSLHQQSIFPAQYLKTLRRFLDAPLCCDTRYILDSDLFITMLFYVANKIEVQVWRCENNLWSLTKQQQQKTIYCTLRVNFQIYQPGNQSCQSPPIAFARLCTFNL